MILFLWTVVFTPIIHDYRHMLWHLIPGDHLNHWVMTYWRTNRMANSARRPVRLVCGGPNCRTWSILRWFPKPNAPLPVRGRAEDLVWGLPTLTDQEQEEVDGESLLILRQMFLTTLMKQNCSLPVASFLEHPRDPIECSSSPSASRCSSLWVTKMFKAWYPTVGHTLVKFDQCRLGQLVPKATCLSSDLAIQCWDGLSCNHPPHKLPEDMQSSDLSRYPPPMMQGLAGAISQALSDIGQEASKPVADWTHQHPSANDELPFRQQVRHMEWIGQPLCLWHTVSHLWMSTWWSNLVLEPDPLEMGGGNLLQDDWYLRYGKTRGLHPWEARSLTSHQNSTKQYKCLSPAGRRTIRSLM